MNDDQRIVVVHIDIVADMEPPVGAQPANRPTMGVPLISHPTIPPAENKHVDS